MKKVTRILGLCALMALVTVSCKKNENTKGGVSFLASITQPTNGAKTHIGADNFLMWNENDAIKVYNTAGEAETFTTSDKDVTLATFNGDITETETYYACYPEGNTIDIANAKATLALSDAQQYAVGGFANGAYPMVATNDEKQFNFRSPFGVLCLQLKGTATVGSIELTDSNMGLAGDFTVALDDMTAIASSSTTGNTITLSCPNVVLNNDAAKSFFMVVPAGAFAQGFTAVVKDMNGNTIHELKTTENNTLLAENILTMPEIKIEYATPSVVTNDADDVTQTTATINGEATAPAGTNLTECGFYWGTSTDALNNKVTTASATSPFSYGLTGLTANTTYYFKAYAKNPTGENYGEVKSFTTQQAVVGDFTVEIKNGTLQKVTLSPGNLWYDNGTWRMEDHQWNYHNGVSGDERGFFFWSYNGGEDYNNNYGLNSGYNSTQDTFADWGNLNICKPGSEETYAPGTWRTLTEREKNVLVYYREQSPVYTDSYNKTLHRIMEVHGTKCLVLAPDNYEGDINSATWAELEAAGAFALPFAGGYCSDPEYHFDEGEQLGWWTSSLSSSNYGMAAYLYCPSSGLTEAGQVTTASRYHMFTVRLVKNTTGW